MDLKELLRKQAELDTIIYINADLEEFDFLKTKLALLTELGELANEVQCFKYWKKNKEINWERVREEFADCLHFALSLENFFRGMKSEFIYNIELLKESFTKLNIEFGKYDEDSFLNVYEGIVCQTDLSLGLILALGIELGITFDEMETAYLKKYEKNLQRQKEGY